MKIGSLGSCLSNMVVNRMIQRFGGEKLFHVYRHRSDQFYHYHVKKDEKIVPRNYIEDNLITVQANTNDPNFVPSTEMLDNQYEKIGKHGTVSDKSFFDILTKEKLDILILDNYLDMSAILSYPKLEGYKSSPVFLRKNDFSNYDDFFNFGEKIALEESAFYFNEIIAYLKFLQPNAQIYFLHYPYNTYVNNPARQIRAKSFEELFESEYATIVPAPIIKKEYQIENDPAHFEESIYITYSGFIYFDFQREKKKSDKLTIQNVLNASRKFDGPEDYFLIPEIVFNADDSWTAAIRIYEFENDQLFNFFFGKRGTRNMSILRRKNQLEFRADDDQYVGGVEFLTKTLNEVVVVYDKGKFVFYNNGSSSDAIEYPTSAIFDAIGSGYDGKQHEQPCFIEKAAIWKKALIPEEVVHCFDKSLIEKDNDLFGYWEPGKEADSEEGKKIVT